MQPVELQVEGTRVHAQHHAPAGKAIGAAILLHGLNSSSIEFGPLPQHLAEAGLHVLAFDQRGFGASGGERGRTGLDHALAETDAAVDWVRQAAGRVPLALVGHSLGGSLALGVVARRGFYRAAAIAHAPRSLMEEVGGLKRAAYHVLGRRAMRRLARGKVPGTAAYAVRPEDLFVDPAAVERAKKAPFLQTRVNLGNYAFAATMDAVAWARRVQVPVWVAETPHDKVVDPAHARAVRQALAGPVEVYAHASGHSLFLDRDAQAACEALCAFFVRRLG